MKNKKEVKVTYRGWGGHFICAPRCLFRLNTLLEVKGGPGVVVSTVGNMVIEPRDDPQEIGAGRYYETMVFLVNKRTKVYKDADVKKEVVFISPWCIDYLRPFVDMEAQAMHEVVVAEIKDKLERGEKLKIVGE